MNAADELAAVSAIVKAKLTVYGLEELLQDLRQVSLALWDAEDRLRALERQSEFGPEFIDCARSIHKSNDRRFAPERRINEMLGSSLFEEKCYS